MDEFWSVPVLKSLLDEIEANYALDRSRVYLTGMNMGDNDAWRPAIAFPNHFAALAPICRWADARAVTALKEVPVCVFHGKKDSAISCEKSEVMVESLQALGGNICYTLYPDAEHDSWSETYNTPEFYHWLLAQRSHALRADSVVCVVLRVCHGSDGATLLPRRELPPNCRALYICPYHPNRNAVHGEAVLFVHMKGGLGYRNSVAGSDSMVRPARRTEFG